MTFEEIDARAIELFSKLRPIEEWPYIDEGDRNYWRKEAGDEPDEPFPGEACRLAAPLERREPEPLHLVEEPPQAPWPSGWPIRAFVFGRAPPIAPGRPEAVPAGCPSRAPDQAARPATRACRRTARRPQMA